MPVNKADRFLIQYYQHKARLEISMIMRLEFLTSMIKVMLIDHWPVLDVEQILAEELDELTDCACAIGNGNRHLVIV